MNVAVLDVHAEPFLRAGGRGSGNVGSRYVRFHCVGIEVRGVIRSCACNADRIHEAAVVLVADLEQHVIDRQFMHGAIARFDKFHAGPCDLREFSPEMTVDPTFVHKGVEFRSDPVLDTFMQAVTSVAEVHLCAGPPASKG